MKKIASLRRGQKALLVCVIAVLAMAAAGCGYDINTPAFCGFVLKDNTRLDKVVPAGVHASSSDDTLSARYIPCNSRNFDVNNSGFKKDGITPVKGDWGEPLTAYTATGTPVLLQVVAYFTPNQQKEALTKMFEVCAKYNCWSNSAHGGNANFSEPGWNGLLRENLLAAMQWASLVAMKQMEDPIWQNHDVTQYDTLAKKMSDAFAEALRSTNGYNVNLFCGSGNSIWLDKNHKQFDCKNVRFKVNDVSLKPVDVQSGQNTEQQNAERLKRAQAAYGDLAGSWLAMQDTLDKCKAKNIKCNFVITGLPGKPVANRSNG